MAWTAPATYTSGNVLTAAMMNAISANLNETGPAKATTSNQLLVSDAANSIFPRTVQGARLDPAGAAGAVASFGDLTTVGPAATVLLSSAAIVFYGALIS